MSLKKEMSYGVSEKLDIAGRQQTGGGAIIELKRLWHVTFGAAPKNRAITVIKTRSI